MNFCPRCGEPIHVPFEKVLAKASQDDKQILRFIPTLSYLLLLIKSVKGTFYKMIRSYVRTQPLEGITISGIPFAQQAKQIQKQSDTSEDTTNAGRSPLIGITWLIGVSLSLVFYVLSIPDRYLQLIAIGIRNQKMLLLIDLPNNFLAVYVITLEIIVVLICLIIASVIVQHKHNNKFALIVALMIALYSIWVTRPMESLNPTHPFIYIPMSVIRALGQILVVITCYTVPDGRFTPRWTLPLAISWILLTTIWLIFPHAPFNGIYSPTPYAPLPLSALLLSFFWYGTGLIVQIYRYRSTSQPVERQQKKWIMLGVAGTLFGIVAFKLFNTMVFKYYLLLWYVLGELAYYSISLLMPLAFGVAILRYRLWNMDVIINRFLVYSGLTICIISIYVCIVGILGTMLHVIGDLSISFLATGIVALLFQLLRHQLQRGIDRLMYREHSDPYLVLSQLWQRMESVYSTEMVLDSIVETVLQTLKAPYVALSIKQEDSFKIAISSGKPREEEPLRLLLIYQTETVGELVVAQRSPGEAFASADIRLLRDIARQAGVAIYAVRLAQRLNAETQRSREHLVKAREEERRRLRRDLHDGLGPTLGGLLLKIGSARSFLFQRPDDADILLKSLESDVKGALIDIRRLVYALRPPELDDLGLINALNEYVAQRNTVIAANTMVSESEQLRISLLKKSPAKFRQNYPA